MQPKIVAEPGEPLTIPLLTSGSQGVAALFTKEGEPVAPDRCEPQTMGEAAFDCHLYENLPEGGYWSVYAIAVGREEWGWKSPYLVVVSFNEVGREIGVRRWTVGNVTLGVPDGFDRYVMERFTANLDEAQVPERVQRYVAELVEKLKSTQGEAR